MTDLKPAYTSDYATGTCDECGKHLNVLIPVLPVQRGPICAECAVEFGWETSSIEAGETHD